MHMYGFDDAVNIHYAFIIGCSPARSEHAAIPPAWVPKHRGFDQHGDDSWDRIGMNPLFFVWDEPIISQIFVHCKLQKSILDVDLPTSFF